MNLLAVVVIIGIGADDSFIFVKIWQSILAERVMKRPPNISTRSSIVEAEGATATLRDLMAATMQHAAVSMLVTSLTTAGAFYASYVSSITSIKCFGIFAGTVVVTNYLLMVTWLPASVSIMERLTAYDRCVKVLALQHLIAKLSKSINRFCAFFESAVIGSVMQHAKLLIGIFFAIGMLSMSIVIYSPGLQLPESAHFQLFVDDHPFEVYESKMKNEFWFERSMAAYENLKLPMRFVWGILPIDNGNYANPYTHGELVYDNNFNVSTKAAQIWLHKFCQNVKEQPFYSLTLGLLLPNCFMENFMTFMNRMCIDGMDGGSDRTPCCDTSKFPYEPEVFELCLPQSISSLYATPREYFLPGVAGPKFQAPQLPLPKHVPNPAQQLKQLHKGAATESEATSAAIVPPLVKAVVIEFESNVSYAATYKEVKQFVQAVETWFQQQLANAPPEMQRGWFISDLKFYDVQDTLAHDTIISIALAMTISLIVLLLVTLNVLISFYAVITVTLTIFTTVALLILLGWKLNILESIAVSTAIGLAVDFSLHYGIHYRMSPNGERTAATQFVLARLVAPTAMAAFTTGLAGAVMLGSTVMPYIQIGIFLVVVMCVSWLYATFFLMSLLKVAGPQFGFLQLRLPKLSKRCSASKDYYERKQGEIVVSKQLLTPTSSAVGEMLSESHELESLTSNSLIKSISAANSCLQSPPSMLVDIESARHSDSSRQSCSINSLHKRNELCARHFQLAAAKESAIAVEQPIELAHAYPKK